MKLKKGKAPDEAAAGAPAAEEEPKKGRKKVFLLALVALLVLATAAWWFMVRPAGADEEPKPGLVVQLEPIQVNLADGHYLKIGIALQGVEGAEELDGSKALDATIELFSGEPMAKLTARKQRTLLKEQLLEELQHSYHGEVMDVYFTDFVTQ